jgi:adenylosuccinate synthase
MQKRIRAVIGANYGDEGKGATTDRLVEDGDTLVVRFNGGAQAGHTVVADDGRRHVFHHVGSGAFKGAPTFLSRHFVSNPMLLAQELAELAAKGVKPRILADRRGLLTTPFDMLVNQVVEAARGGGRHGSCGYGFGETIERAEKGFRTTLEDVFAPGMLRTKLRAIRDVWVPARLARLGVETIPDDYAAFFEGDGMIEAFVAAAGDFANAVLVGDDSPLRDAKDVVFEGAQGLLLDQDRGAFPHVTRSNTGLKNVLALAQETGIDRIEAVYATRSYLTRHGAGPLPGELAEQPFEGIVDATNVPNAWQGTLRFALLDVDLLARTVLDDLGDAKGSGIDVTPSLAINCLDQAPDETPVISVGRATKVSRDSLLPFALGRLGWNDGIEGWGAVQLDWKTRSKSKKAA